MDKMGAVYRYLPCKVPGINVSHEEIGLRRKNVRHIPNCCTLSCYPLVSVGHEPDKVPPVDFKRVICIKEAGTSHFPVIWFRFTDNDLPK